MEATAEWTKDNIQTLLNAMKSSIPSRESEKTWNTGLKTLDWTKVAFEPFSSEECRVKWQEIMQKLRKVKTLTELIVDAEDAIVNLATKVPKKPISANALFISENMDTFRKKHPEMHSRELMKYANKAYKKLSAKDKEKYLKKVLRSKEDYKAKVITDNSEDNTETQLVPPSKPPMTAYNLFCREQKSNMTGIPRLEITSVWAQRWKKLSPEEKGEYSRRCHEMKEEYNDKLYNLLSGMNKKKKELMIQKYRLKTITSKKRSATDKMFLGEPPMPISRTPHELFHNKQLTKMNKTGLTPKEHFSKASHKFNSLSPEKKQLYQEKVDESLQMYAVKLQRWFETLTAAEQQEYCEHNPDKLKFLRCKRGLRASYHRTSDSEDEDLEDSSSSSESDDIVVTEPKENEEEDEEEDDIMFDIF